MCKTVENPVDCAENLHIPAKIRLFSRIYAKNLWKTFVGVTFFVMFFVHSFYNFYKTIDF